MLIDNGSINHLGRGDGYELSVKILLLKLKTDSNVISKSTQGFIY